VINCKCCHVRSISLLIVACGCRFKVVKSFGVKGAVSVNCESGELVLIMSTAQDHDRVVGPGGFTCTCAYDEQLSCRIEG